MSEGGSDNTTVKIIAIIGGVIVVIVLSCGVLGYFFVKSMKEMAGGFQETVNKARETSEAAEAMAQDTEQSQVAANSFVRDLQTNNLDRAFESTTEDFKKRMTRKDLDELVKRHPSLTGGLITPPTPIDIPTVPPPSPQTLPSTYRFRYEASGKDGKGKIEITVTVAKEGGQMKVDQLAVTKPAANDEKPER
jgi:hypothetical protein